jgi:glyoxylase-like metal-dependent hydrolase (beta-lactamase superfamily II)
MMLEFQLLEAGHCVHPEMSTRIGGSFRSCEFPALVALLRHPHHGWILFDTGYGQAFLDATRRLPEAAYQWVTPVRWSPVQAVAAQLYSRGIGAADVSTVLVSHFHGDHVGALADFPTARIFCARAAWEDLHGHSRMGALAKGLLPLLAPPGLAHRLTFFESAPTVRLPPDLAPFNEGYDIFGDASTYAVSLPGHAAGHFGVCFRAARSWVFLVGDAAWSMRAILDNCPPPRWTTGLLGNTRAYRQTLASLHALAGRKSNVTLIPSHCSSLRPSAVHRP